VVVEKLDQTGRELAHWVAMSLPSEKWRLLLLVCCGEWQLISIEKVYSGFAKNEVRLMQR